MDQKYFFRTKLAALQCVPWQVKVLLQRECSEGGFHYLCFMFSFFFLGGGDSTILFIILAILVILVIILVLFVNLVIICTLLRLFLFICTMTTDAWHLHRRCHLHCRNNQNYHRCQTLRGHDHPDRRMGKLSGKRRRQDDQR